jgi:peptidyl-tRNA hydrolase
MNESILYIIMRNDLAMNTGRIAAQASHAANAFIHAARQLPKHIELLKNIASWEKSTDQGFGTALILTANVIEINDAISKLRNAGFCSSVVDDPTFGYTVNSEIAKLIPSKEDTAPRQYLDGGKVRIFRNEMTCAYAFGTKEELKPYLGHLLLHP